MKGQIDIEKLTAFVIRDQDGTEGIVGFFSPLTGWLPMIAADEDRISQLEPIAQAMADEMQLTISLVEFTVRDNVRQIEPNRLKKESHAKEESK